MKIVSTDPLSAPQMPATAGSVASAFLKKGQWIPVDSLPSFSSVSTFAPRAPLRAFLGGDVDFGRSGQFEHRLGVQQFGIVLDRAAHFLPRIFADQRRSAIAQRLVGGKGDDVGEPGVRDHLIGVGIAEPRGIDRQRHRLKSTGTATWV